MCATLQSDNSIKIFDIQNNPETDSPILKQLDLTPNAGLNQATCLRFESLQSLVYCGYNMNTCRFDINKNKVTWKSKESQRDELNLREPIKNHSLAIDSKQNLIWISSNLHGLTCLAPSQQKKPVKKIQFKQDETRARGDKIAISKSGRLVYCSDVLGQVHIYDTRKVNAPVRKIKHSLACLEDLVLSNDGNLLGTIGLDRFLRVYQTPSETEEPANISTPAPLSNLLAPKMVCEKYLKTKLSSLFIESRCSLILTDNIKAYTETITTTTKEDTLGKRKELELLIHEKDKFDIEKIFPTRKEALNIKLRNRIREKVKLEGKLKRVH